MFGEGVAEGGTILKAVGGGFDLVFGGVDEAGGEAGFAVWGEGDFGEVAVSVQVVGDSLLGAFKSARSVAKEDGAVECGRDVAFDIGDFVVEFL